MALVSLEDPGLTVFATHRMLKGLDSKAQEGIRDAAKAELRAGGGRPRTRSSPAPTSRRSASATWTPTTMQPWRLRLKPEGAAALDEILADRSEAYRRLDAAALEELFLKRAVGLSPDDIAAKKGLGYTPSTDEALAKLKAKEYDAAFFLRPTPVEQVREVAAAGETMPPKSTYFFPKLLTGIVFNPLGLRSARGQDLHAQGRRRLHLALVRRPRRRRPTRAPRPTARSTRRTPPSASPARSAARSRSGSADDILHLQHELFVAGAELATAPEAADRLEDGVSRVTEAMVDALEAEIDRYMSQVELPPQFVIPGGTELSAALDVARAAIRRAERRIVALRDAEGLASEARSSLPQPRLGPGLRDGPLRRRAQPEAVRGTSKEEPRCVTPSPAAAGDTSTRSRSASTA